MRNTLQKTINILAAAIPLVVFFGGPYLATNLNGLFDRIVLAIIWGAYLFKYSAYEKQERAFNKSKQHLYTIEKIHYNQERQLNIARHLFSPEQEATFWEETRSIGYTPYEYQEFDQYEYEETRKE